MAHQWYRTCRAVLNKAHLIYDYGHPGYVPQERNPFNRLGVGLPKARLVVWPKEEVAEIVTLADSMNRPSLGDAIMTMMWLGVRRQDWLTWPANIFDTPYLAWDTEKTDAPVTIPRSVVPELRQRIEAAKARRQSSAVRATTFFVDDVGQRPWSTKRFHSAFNEVRTALAATHASFSTRYAVKHYPADPMRIPTAWLTMRVLLDRYTKLTVDQAGAALTKRLDHKSELADRTAVALHRRYLT